MSSQILAYGFIEIPAGTEQENSGRLLSLCSLRDSSESSLLSSISDARLGWPSSVMAFARSFKKVDVDLHSRLRTEFESILYSLNAISAHLCIEDEEGLVSCRLSYTFGPMKCGDSDSWTCAEVVS